MKLFFGVFNNSLNKNGIEMLEKRLNVRILKGDYVDK